MTKFTPTWAHLRRLRQAVQLLAFTLFIYLLFAALQRRAVFPLADLFFRLDPLAALAATLASRPWGASGMAGCTPWARCWNGYAFDPIVAR